MQLYKITAPLDAGLTCAGPRILVGLLLRDVLQRIFICVFALFELSPVFLLGLLGFGSRGSIAERIPTVCRQGYDARDGDDRHQPDDIRHSVTSPSLPPLHERIR